MSASQYARLVPKKYRSRTLPKINRPWRPRVIAWAGPAAFYPNRFYEIDKWYKARIDKPEKIPEMHIIEPTEHTRSLKEILAGSGVDAINIGFKKRESAIKATTSEQEKAELERKSRHMQLEIEFDNLDVPSLDMCKHFRIFDHLFGEGTYFENVQQMEISYGDNVVYNGNIIATSNTSEKPEVKIENIGAAGFNTILMVNLDGNAFENKGELVQWMVTNVPDGEPLTSGKEVVEYLQPLPFYGTGYHRVAFVLFRHSSPVQLLDDVDSKSLSSRVHEIAALYKKNESLLTPSSIRFMQSSYDDSVKKTLHSLGLKSPLYEYEYNAPLKPQQKEFPERPQPFDLYLDMFRDPKEVEVEMLEKRLATAQLGEVQEPKWRDLNYNENKKNLPSWLHNRMLSREGRHKSQFKNNID